MFNKTLFACFLLLNLNQFINASVVKNTESGIFGDEKNILNKKLVINDIDFLTIKSSKSIDDYVSFAETKSIKFSKSKDALESNSKQLICEDNDDKEVECSKYGANTVLCLNKDLKPKPDWDCKITSAKITNKNVKIDQNEINVECKKSDELNSQYYLPGSCVLHYKLSKLENFNAKDDVKEKKGGLGTGWVVFIVFAVLLVASFGIFFVCGQNIVNATCPNSSTGNKLASMTMNGGSSTGGGLSGTQYR